MLLDLNIPEHVLAPRWDRVWSNLSLDPSMKASNLFRFKEVMDSAGIRFYLMFGTLLGAVRNGAFIPWDEDVDVAIHERDSSKVGELLKGGSFAPLELVRCATSYFSLAGGNSYLDVYIYFDGTSERSHGKYVYCNFNSLAFDVPTRSFDQAAEIDFLGKKFLAPRDPESHLEWWYGSKWREPVQWKSINKS